jgi:ATP-dependent Lhr-like helicase
VQVKLAPAEQWFAAQGWQPLAFQREVWQAYGRGESGLVHAATGTGKTLAAWWGPLLEYLEEGKRRAVPPLRVLWLTPLRALAADTREALLRPAEDLGLSWKIETRTGDTGSAQRARQSKRLPTALITTPESLSLLLTREDAPELFHDLRAVIVDEWHELMATKRGVQVELALARLRRLQPSLRTWGLSATIGNLATARDALLGAGGRGPIVRGDDPKRVVIDSLIPPVIERFPWAGHLGTQMIPQVVEAIAEGRTALVFTNTRSQTEIWYQALLAARPDWAGQIALHHGSLDRTQRDWVEQGLRTGALRCVVATSSLDLGVDFSPVDRVLQVGSPKGVARLLQRAGRSGHQPGGVSRVTCVPTNALELLEVAAVRDGIHAGKVEARLPVERPLDVLAQHLVTVAMGGGFRPAELLAEVRSTRAYAGLTDEEWEWTLRFVSVGGDALGAYPEYARLRVEDGLHLVRNREIARRHKMSIGTIVGDGTMKVAYLRGRTLGSVEESFISKLRPKDRFYFAGTALELVRVRDMTAWVKKAPSTKGAIPRWGGSRMPLSGALAQLVRDRLGEAADGIFRDPELEALRPLLEVQAKWSVIPRPDELLIERARSRDGWHLFFYPFEGRLVHEGLAALIGWRLARVRPITFSMSANDQGFEMLSADPPPIEEGLGEDLFSPDNLSAEILAALNATEMARRQFREIARVTGLVFPGFPHAGKTARQLQASSSLFFDVFQRYDPGNMLLAQAQREVLEKQLEQSRLALTLRRLTDSSIVLKDPPRMTPLAFPLLVDRTRNKLSSESLGDRVRKMQLTLERAAG